MRLVLWSGDAGFMERAEPFLLADEPRHHMIFTIVAGLRDSEFRASLPPGSPFLATIEDHGRVVAAAARQPGSLLVVSPDAGIDFSDGPVLEELADVIQAQSPDLSRVMAPPAVAEAFGEAWLRRTGQPWRRILVERSHVLRTVRPVRPVSGRMRQATTADRAWVIPSLHAMHTAIFGTGPDAPPFDPEHAADRRLAPPDAPGDPMRSLYVWDDSGPRAMAGAQWQTPHGIRIGAVYTPPEHRRQGYATNLVAALSQRLLDLGRRYCFLFTDLGNPTSNRIYAEIGYEPVYDVDEIRLGR